MNAYRSGIDLVGLLLRVSLGEEPAALPEGRAGVLTHLAMQALLGSRRARRHAARNRQGMLAPVCDQRALCRQQRRTDAGESGLDQRRAAGDDGGVAAGLAEVGDQARTRRVWRASAGFEEYSDDRGGGIWHKPVRSSRRAALTSALHRRPALEGCGHWWVCAWPSTRTEDGRASGWWDERFACDSCPLQRLVIIAVAVALRVAMSPSS